LTVGPNKRSQEDNAVVIRKDTYDETSTAASRGG
jgi:hypothetical protein